jgi:Flp pilus assembly protein CpaB
MRTFLGRHRRLLAAIFAAAAAAFGLAAARPHPDGVQVLVAGRDLAGGAVLGPRDVATRVLPARAVPAGAVRAAVGRVLSGPVRRGEPLTDMRLSRSGGPLRTRDPASVAVPIRLADAGVARLVHPGDRVDVLASRADGPLPARTVASGVPVLAVPKPGPDTDEGALVVVETGREQAAALARASVDSRLSITILGG